MPIDKNNENNNMESPKQDLLSHTRVDIDENGYQIPEHIRYTEIKDTEVQEGEYSYAYANKIIQIDRIAEKLHCGTFRVVLFVATVLISATIIAVFVTIITLRHHTDEPIMIDTTNNPINNKHIEDCITTAAPKNKDLETLTTKNIILNCLTTRTQNLGGGDFRENANTTRTNSFMCKVFPKVLPGLCSL
ncbi:unnamed protein product [Owenia fusiformis]|uniref:Uncharacterized protein n=1 Tax=Owenia fusiformis TaxID=6347 RepID=A0A8S4QBP2_OWEFU|nr:unnamed protein product [Owenia fusiformis]